MDHFIKQFEFVLDMNFIDGKLVRLTHRLRVNLSFQTRVRSIVGPPKL